MMSHPRIILKAFTCTVFQDPYTVYRISGEHLFNTYNARLMSAALIALQLTMLKSCEADDRYIYICT